MAATAPPLLVANDALKQPAVSPAVRARVTTPAPVTVPDSVGTPAVAAPMALAGAAPLPQDQVGAQPILSDVPQPLNDALAPLDAGQSAAVVPTGQMPADLRNLLVVDPRNLQVAGVAGDQPVTPFPDKTVLSQGPPQSQVFPDGTTVVALGNGQTQQTSPDGMVTIFDANQQPVSMKAADGTRVEFLDGGLKKQINPDGSVTIFDRNNQPVSGTTADGAHLLFLDGGRVEEDKGDQHTVFGPDGRPIEAWTGNDPSQASFYRHNSDGTVTVTDPTGVSTTFDQNGVPISTTRPDGTTIVWAVDLPALEDGARKVRGLRASLEEAHAGLRKTFDDIEAAWQAPSVQTFTPLRNMFDVTVNKLLGLLDDAATRMQQTHDNIVATEQTNTNNVTTRQGGH
jgi:hypothetical protein